MECISEDTNHVTDTHDERDALTSDGAGLVSSAPSETMNPCKRLRVYTLHNSKKAVTAD